MWEWYGWRRGLVASCRPNPGHRALARWMLSRPGVTLVTQNVDALHERAAREAATALGVAPEPAYPIRLHGSIHHVRCTTCDFREEHDGPVDATSVDTLPRCPHCEGLYRPDVVWFGESLPEAALAAAMAAAERADICLVIGTAGAVQPAAGLAQAVAEHGALVVLDPGATAFDGIADVKLTGAAGALLPKPFNPSTRAAPRPRTAPGVPSGTSAASAAPSLGFSRGPSVHFSMGSRTPLPHSVHDPS